MKILSMALLFFSLSLMAKILEYKIAPGHNVKISLEHACEIFDQRHILFADVIDNQLDCMGHRFQLSTLCAKHRPETFPINLVQASYDKQTEMITCRFSDQVEFKLECGTKNSSYCDNSRITCTKIKSKIAVELTLIRAFSLQKKGGKKELNCLYSSSDKSLEKSNNSFQADKDFENYLRSL